jgi:hypothetical protein
MMPVFKGEVLVRVSSGPASALIAGQSQSGGGSVGLVTTEHFASSAVPRESGMIW